MIDYAKLMLWNVSISRNLFKNELIKLINWADKQEITWLKNYCYEKYLDMHPDVLDEVFFRKTGHTEVSPRHTITQSLREPIPGRLYFFALR
jgi:hypothetical protein